MAPLVEHRHLLADFEVRSEMQRVSTSSGNATRDASIPSSDVEGQDSLGAAWRDRQAAGPRAVHRMVLDELGDEQAPLTTPLVRSGVPLGHRRCDLDQHGPGSR